MSRLVLLEIRTADPYRTHRSDIFPYLLGLALARSVEAEWWRIGVPDECHVTDGERRFDLPANLSAAVAGALSAMRPDVVVLNDRPAAAAELLLRAAAPEARLIDLTEPGYEPFDDIGLTVGRAAAGLGGLGAGDGSGEDACLLDAVQPCFEIRSSWMPPGLPVPIRLLHDHVCPYVRPVSSNPAYRTLDDPGTAHFRGCAFCDFGLIRPKLTERRQLPQTDPVSLLLTQVAAHQRSTRGDDRPAEYLLEWGRVCLRLDSFLTGLLEQNLRPCLLTAMLRADTLLRLGPRLKRIVPAMAGAGHRLRLVSVGAENFSDAENVRFNKGLSADRLEACLDLIDDLHGRFPDTFEIERSVFAGILFTPWTTPDDLAANVRAARRLGPDWLNRMAGSRLQLVEGTPITALARQDGLAGGGFGSASELTAWCRTSPDQADIPWRFADLRTERLLRLLIRLEPQPPAARIPTGDRLLSEIAAARALLPLALATDYVGLALGLVEAVVALGPAAGVGELFERLGRRSASPGPESDDGQGSLAVGLIAPGQAGRLEFRVGETCPADHVRLPRAGGAWLWVAEDRLGGGEAGRAAPVVLAAMRLLTGDRLRPDEASRWQEVMVRLAARAGLAGRYRWDAAWRPGRDRPAGSG